mmetsp:Transcript_23161/g.38165  ORF Transcript_23161/g.38165 Transcript_23161/m.38165 type:complete len:244 (+) Transcript_23161:192-923(+)
MPQYASISTPYIIIPTLLLLLIIITCKSHELIGFIYGPSSQLFATKQQIIQANLLSRILSNNEATTTTTTITTTVTTWMARIATTAEQIYNPHYELAYQHDCKTCILHDAGVIAALFAILHACNFFGDTISKRQQQQQQQQRRRFHYFFMAGALFILPGMIGQLVISKTIPIEIVLLNRFNTDTSLNGMLESLLYVGYCSWKSVLDHHYDGGDGVYRIVAMGNAMYELKVVGVALALVAFFLG